MPNIHSPLHFICLVIISVITSFPCFLADGYDCEIVLSYKCLVHPLYGNSDIETFINNKLEKERQINIGDSSEMDDVVRSIVLPSSIFIVDLNNDNTPEYIVPMYCGAVGNCR